MDLACGHGLLAHLMVLLDDTSSTAIAADVALPASAARVRDVLAAAWPRLADRVTFVAGGPHDVPLFETDVVVSCHACGALTNRVIDRAVAARARFAVLPCCHDARTCDVGDLDGWMDVPLAIDATRVARLRAAGYFVRTQLIPEAITPKNRLILAEPGAVR